MALITCKECGKEISDSAKSCTHCGYVLPVEPKRAPHIPLIDQDDPRNDKNVTNVVLSLNITFVLTVV